MYRQERPVRRQYPVKEQPCASIIEFGVFSDQALKAAERCAAGVTETSECSLCDHSVLYLRAADQVGLYLKRSTLWL